MWKLFLASVACLSFSVASSAGVLWLRNGDHISGELIIIADGQVRWQSDMAGEIDVPQIYVVGIEARDLFEVDLDGHRTLSQCQLQVRADHRQLLNCKEGEARVSSWKLVNKVSALPLIKHDTWHNTGYVTASARDSGGNSEEQDLQLELTNKARRGSIRHTVDAAYGLQRLSGVKSQDNRKVEYQFDYFLNQKWYSNSLASWSRNVFQDLESRTLVSSGAGYQFFDTELIRLSVEGGLGYVSEIYANDADRKAPVLRESTDFAYRLNALGLEFFHRNTFLQLLNGAGDWRLQTETGFKLPVIGRLTAQTKLIFDYQNVPADDAGPLDRTWLFGVNYDW